MPRRALGLRGSIVRSALRTRAVIVPSGGLPNIDDWTFVSNFEFRLQGGKGVVYNDDGSRIYVGSSASASKGFIHHNTPNLTTPYVPAVETTPLEILARGSDRLIEIDWSSDGTKVYAAELGGDQIAQLDNAGTAYNPGVGDLTESDTFAVTPIDPVSIYVKPDGSALFYISLVDDALHQVTMSTPDDLTTAAMGDSFSPAEADMLAVVFAEDGSNFYLMGQDEVIYEYLNSAPWVISPAPTYTGRSLDLSGFVVVADTPWGMSVSPDGSKMIVGLSNTTPADNGIMYFTIP